MEQGHSSEDRRPPHTVPPATVDGEDLGGGTTLAPQTTSAFLYSHFCMTQNLSKTHLI